ncbi:MAG: hypothetical protein CMN28_03160 [Salinisphaeraceae bacterium]|nr:hypothetical protein [Salinisphaeraceae bacterium]
MNDGAAKLASGTGGVNKNSGDAGGALQGCFFTGRRLAENGGWPASAGALMAVSPAIPNDGRAAAEAG